MARTISTLAVLTAAALVGGCHFVGATTHNLDELHASDGHHLRSGRVLNHLEWAAQVGFSQLLHSVGSKPADTAPKKIEDPVEECVRQLADLKHFDSTVFSTGSIQVEYFARIAAYDAWHLSREIAVQELGKAGRRLELAEHPAPPPTGSTATPDQVRDALQHVLDTANAAILNPNQATREAFAKASTAMADLPLDIDGALRVLRSIDIVLRATKEKDERVAPLRPASLELQRKLVTLALERALKDDPPSTTLGTDPGWPNARVQAAAIEASVSVWGGSKLRELILAAPRPFMDSDPTRLASLLQQVARYGLPPVPPQMGPAQARETQRAWTSAIVVQATQNPTASVRLAAMNALGKVSGKGRSTLREEEWQEWWAEQGTPAVPENQGP